MSSVPDVCSCLQQLVQLVCKLDELQFADPRLPQGGQRAPGRAVGRAALGSLMHCARCARKDSQDEALLLFATSIRTLFFAAKKVCRLLGGAASASAQQPHQVATAAAPPSNALLDISVAVGRLELVGEVKTEVLHLVARRTLKGIMPALIHLSQRRARRPNS